MAYALFISNKYSFKLNRITFARYPNRAMFGRRARGDELCKLSRKLLKICHEWMNDDPNCKPPYCIGDALKIRRQVLEREYPTICAQLTSVLGITCKKTCFAFQLTLIFTSD